MESSYFWPKYVQNIRSSSGFQNSSYFTTDAVPFVESRVLVSNIPKQMPLPIGFTLTYFFESDTFRMWKTGYFRPNNESQMAPKILVQDHPFSNCHSFQLELSECFGAKY